VAGASTPGQQPRIEAILTPVQAPKAKPITERVMDTWRRRYLDHLTITNERYLRSVMQEYVEHHNGK
jgi:hypothetical protein